MNEMADFAPPAIKLPQRELEVLSLAAQGLTDKQISAHLNISRDTVGTYWRRIMLRYQASSRTEVVAKAMEMRIAENANASKSEHERLLQEMHDRSEAQAKELAQRNLLSAIQEALVGYLEGATSAEVVLGGLVRLLMEQTHSSIGFVLEAALSDSKSCAKTGVAFIQDANGDERSEQLSETDIASLRALCEQAHGQEILILQPKNDSLCHLSIEDKSVPIRTFLGVPVHSKGEPIGMVAVANTAEVYDANRVEHLQPLTSTCAALLAAMRASLMRRASDLESKETTANLIALLDSLDDAVVFIDDKRRVRFVNRAYCESFAPGMSPQEVVGQGTQALYERFRTLWPASEEMRAQAQEVIARGEPVLNESVQTSDGRKFLRDFQPVRLGAERIGHVWKFRQID